MIKQGKKRRDVNPRETSGSKIQPQVEQEVDAIQEKQEKQQVV